MVMLKISAHSPTMLIQPMGQEARTREDSLQCLVHYSWYL